MTHPTPTPDPTGTDARYTVGEVAERLGLTLRTLKYYEELGLVTPERSGGGYRLYGEADIARLERVRRMRALGLSLGTIARTFTQPLERDPSGRQVMTRDSLQTLHRDLQAQLQVLHARIDAARRELKEAQALERDLQGDLQYLERRLNGETLDTLMAERRSEADPDTPTAE